MGIFGQDSASGHVADALSQGHQIVCRDGLAVEPNLDDR